MNIFKKCAVKALSLAVALITALSFGASASAAAKTAEIMSNDWSILAVFFKSVDVTVKLSGKTVSLKKTVSNAKIDDIKNGILDRMPYQFMQDTHGKVGIDAIDYAYVDEPLTNKDIESVPDTDGTGYRAKYEDSKLVSGVLDECLEQNLYSQILVFTPLGEISLTASGWGGSKYKGVHIAQILTDDYNDIGYYSTILHEICHGLETDSKALNNNKTAPLHDMYVGNNLEIAELDWYEYYMNDIRPDGKKGVEPMAFYRPRNEKHTPLAGKMTVTTPQNLSTAANSNTAATLSWDGLTGSGYQVGLFKDADHKKLKTTYDVKSGEASFKLTDLVKGNTYYIGVRAASTANGKTYCSDWVCLTYTHGGVASGVKNFRVEDLSKDRSAKLKFSWDAVPNASGYQIAQFGSTFKDYDDVYNYKSGTTSAVLGPFTRYTYRYFGIRASETIAGKKVWSDWTYLAFDFWDDIELIDINASQQETKTPTSILSLSVEIKDQVYTGKALTPDITLKDGSKTLKNGTDYVLIYKNNKEIGTASVTVEAMGDYCDEGILTFQIVPKKTTLTAKKSGEKIKLSWKSVKGAEKYVIYYREKGSSKYKELTTVSGSKTSYSTSKLDKNMTYQFKIRSYAEAGGKKYYSNYSKVVTTK